MGEFPGSRPLEKPHSFLCGQVKATADIDDADPAALTPAPPG